MIELDLSEATAIITVGDGGGPNLLTIDTLVELHRALDRIAGHESLRAVVVRGGGDRYFLAGADLNELARLDGESSLRFARLGQSLFDKMERSGKLIVAAVDGYCMGGGIDLLLACDLRYATPSSVFSHPGLRMGIITGFGGTARLPGEVGCGRAWELFVTGRRFYALEAAEYGLISGVVEPGALMERCLEIASKAAAIPAELVLVWKEGAASRRDAVASCSGPDGMF